MKLKKYKTQQNDFLSSKLKSYSALTGAFLLSAGAAHSQVVFTDLNPDTVLQNSTFDIDFDHDGIRDFRLQHYTSAYYHAEMRVNLLPGVDPANRVMAAMANFMWFSLYAPLNLPAGNPIGPGGPFYSFGVASNHMLMAKRWRQQGIGSQYYWTGRGPFYDSTGYIGVEFHSHGNTYYGWIECVLNDNDTLGSVRLTGYAYNESPNNYIIAGAGNTIGIQEPESAIKPSAFFYPNPTQNGKTFIRIDAKQNSDLTLEVINSMGQVLQSEGRNLHPGRNIIELDVKTLPDGTYFVKLMEGDKAYFRKIIVSK